MKHLKSTILFVCSFSSYSVMPFSSQALEARISTPFPCVNWCQYCAGYRYIFLWDRFHFQYIIQYILFSWKMGYLKFPEKIFSKLFWDSLNEKYFLSHKPQDSRLGNGFKERFERFEGQHLVVFNCLALKINFTLATFKTNPQLVNDWQLWIFNQSLDFLK